MCTLKDLELKQLAIEKKKWLQEGGPKPKIKSKEIKVAKSNDFIFDKENLQIIKKGQLKLL